MAKPSNPRWATGAADVDEPDPGDKAVGWVDGDSAPAGWMNWLQLETHKFLAWLDYVGGVARSAELRRLTASPPAAGSNPAAPLDVSLSLLANCPFVLALTPSSCALVQGTTNRKIKISGGVLMQPTADGVLSIELDGTDEVEIQNAAGATPRVDLVQIKIEVDSTTDDLRTKKTISIVQGTPNASPTVPALTAGYVALATVVVGASYAAAAGFSWDDTAGAVAVVHDQRMPIGVTGYLVRAVEMIYSLDATNGWSHNNGQLLCNGTGAGQSDLVAVVPSTLCGRIVAASVLQKDPGPAGTYDIRFARYFSSTIGAGTANLNGANALQTFVNTDVRKNNITQPALEAVHTPAAGPTVQASAAGVGVPVWSNGRRAWLDPFIIDSTVMSSGGIKWISSTEPGQLVFNAEIWVAGR